MMYIYNMKKQFFISLLLPFLFFSQSDVEFDFYDDCSNKNFGKPNTVHQTRYLYFLDVLSRRRAKGRKRLSITKLPY